MAKYTQKAIISCFVDLLEKMNLDKITVKDICLQCEINRNTFYYYYYDLYEVLEDMLTSQRVIANNKINDSFSFYEEYKMLYLTMLQKKSVLKNIYESRGREQLEKYFDDITEQFVEKHVKKRIGQCKLINDGEQYIIDFYCNTITGMTWKWIRGGMKEDGEKLIWSTSEAFEHTIDELIKVCSIKK